MKIKKRELKKLEYEYNLLDTKKVSINTFDELVNEINKKQK